MAEHEKTTTLLDKTTHRRITLLAKIWEISTSETIDRLIAENEKAAKMLGVIKNNS